MYQIRRSVFETNSSSTHSVSIKNSNDKKEFKLIIDRDTNKVISGFGEFGWEIENYFDADTKLRYLITLVLELNRNTNNKDFSIYEIEDFKKIEEVVSEHCNCSGIEVLGDLEIEENKYSKEYSYYVYSDFGYIDHQSCDEYNSLQDFLDEWNVTIEEFIFDPNVILHTDNDNYWEESL